MQYFQKANTLVMSSVDNYAKIDRTVVAVQTPEERPQHILTQWGRRRRHTCTWLFPR